MKAILSTLAATALIGVIVFAMVNPHGGVVYQSPLMALGLGLIGLGLCKHVQAGCARVTR